ncbi:MAG: class I SAM-dependent methyltransferase [Synergistales bacterium]|nr:class I SAM-dependent methyltransferase [Synergistales bacterium]
MPRIDPFERHSDAYDRWFEEHADLYRAELEAVRRLLPEERSEGIEIGVGSGKFAAPLGIAKGVEPSTAMAAKAREEGIEVESGVAESLPFEDDCLGFALMVTTICFVDDIDGAFGEAYRVLRPGGALVVGFVDRESDLGRQYEKHKDESAFYREATFFSSIEVQRHLREAGFSLDRVIQTLLPGDTPPEIIIDGSGSGAFVVIRALKGGGKKSVPLPS